MAGTSHSGAAGNWRSPIYLDEDENPLMIEAHNRRLREERQAADRLLAEWANSLNSRVNRDRGSDRSTPSGQSERDFEERFEQILEGEIADIIDLTGDEDSSFTPEDSAEPIEEEEILPSHRLNQGFVIVPGTTVELVQNLGEHQINFIRVCSIFRRRSNPDVRVRGTGFTRTRELKGLLPKKLNEVAMVVELRDHHILDEQANLELKASDILCRRELRITNAPFPAHRFEPTSYGSMGRTWVEENGPLVCRWRFVNWYNSGSHKPRESALVKIMEDDADPEFRIADSQNLCRWRGGKVPGGSYNPAGLSLPVVDLDAGPGTLTTTPRLGQRYTAGDVFSGAGGSSRGIERAGVKLSFAVDHWKPAVESLRSNFRDAKIYEMEVTDFINDPNIQGTVDILHLSPPCQFWSPAHTVAGKNDEQNQVILFRCTDLVKKFRPRLFTVEQTFGLMHDRFEEFFNTFIHGFTDHDYSVRWKVVHLQSYGVPQTRKRLIVIGSAPGEALPPFPPVTHVQNPPRGSNLRPWTTPQSALSIIPDNFQHPLHEVRKYFDPPRPAWDPTQPAKTITCNGGVGNYHWSGTRDFTLLEYAVLQGFPTWHRFEGGSYKKQIGNAFTPSVVKIFYKHLVDWLLKQDGFDPSVRSAERVPSPGDVVSLVEDDSDDQDVEMEEEAEMEEVILLESRSRSPWLSESVGRLNRAARVGGNFAEPVMLDSMQLDDLSDTETLRGQEKGQRIDEDLSVF